MKCYKKHSNKLGFTLLETLLIIAILGILTAITLSTYQKRSSVTKIEKAAIEMEQILQAASTFYVIGATPNPDKTNRWPAYESLTDQMPDYFLDYLPITATTPTVILNPWGKTYFIDGSQKDKFEVQTETPNADTAKTLAAKLPFGSIDPNNNKKVSAYVPAPAQSNLIISSIGVAKNGSSISIPQGCPEGTDAAYISAINYIRAGLKHIHQYTDPSKNEVNTSHIVGAPISLSKSSAQIVDANYWRLTLDFKQVDDCAKKNDCKDVDQVPASGYEVWDGKNVETRALYFTFCRPTPAPPK